MSDTTVFYLILLLTNAALQIEAKQLFFCSERMFFSPNFALISEEITEKLCLVSFKTVFLIMIKVFN